MYCDKHGPLAALKGSRCVEVIMNTGKKYNTKQKESILECIKENAEEYITIQKIYDELMKKGQKVGLTTIYRNLDKLEAEKEIVAINIEGYNGTCYKYLIDKKDNILFYIKCEQCGNLIHIQCPELSGLYEHLEEEHHIQINPVKTMFYGRCESCLIE